MATKGDVSGLDELIYGGEPLVPLTGGFSRRRTVGAIQSDVNGGLTRQRKKFYNQSYTADVTYYLGTPEQQDFMKIFFERNEGKPFIAYLRADRPILEPYVVQVLGEWEDNYVSAVDATITFVLEIVSARDRELDDALFPLYQATGDNISEAITGIERIVLAMPTLSDAIESVPCIVPIPDDPDTTLVGWPYQQNYFNGPVITDNTVDFSGSMTDATVRTDSIAGDKDIKITIAIDSIVRVSGSDNYNRIGIGRGEQYSASEGFSFTLDGVLNVDAGYDGGTLTDLPVLETGDFVHFYVNVTDETVEVFFNNVSYGVADYSQISSTPFVWIVAANWPYEAVFTLYTNTCTEA